MHYILERRIDQIDEDKIKFIITYMSQNVEDKNELGVYLEFNSVRIYFHVHNNIYIAHQLMCQIPIARTKIVSA